MDVLRRLAPLGAVLGLLVGCGEVGEPDLGVQPAATTSTTVTAESGPDAAAAPTERPAPFVAQLTPSRPVGFVPEVLVADPQGVRLLDGPVLLPSVVADRAYDDPTGGLVVDVDGPGGRQIVWYPATAPEGQVVSEGSGRLMDVGFVDGSVHAVVADGPQVRLLRLGDPDERVLRSFEDGTTVSSVSAAAGLYALVLDDAACGALRFLDPDGNPLDVGGDLAPACPTPGRSTYGLVAVSPDGETFAFTRRQFRSDGVVAGTELVVRDLAGTERFRAMVADEGQAVLSLALDGQQLVLLRVVGEVGEVVRIDQGTGLEPVVTLAPGARSATFTRVPPGPRSAG